MSNQTADELRAEAARHDQNAADSFERCDTDGFLSQWASGLNAQKARRQAEIVEAGGVATFSRFVVTDLATGERLGRDDAKMIDTQYGRSWRVRLSSGEVVWATAYAKRASTYERKGFAVSEEFEVAPATADLRGANATSVSVYVRPANGEAIWERGFDGCYGVGDLVAEATEERRS